MATHFMLFVSCENGHETAIGSVPDFKKSVKPEEIIASKRPNKCSKCESPINSFLDALSIKKVSDADSADAAFQRACREWAI